VVVHLSSLPPKSEYGLLLQTSHRNRRRPNHLFLHHLSHLHHNNNNVNNSSLDNSSNINNNIKGKRRHKLVDQRIHQRGPRRR